MEYAPLPQQRLPRGLKRTYLTFVASITDDPDLQPVIPQILIGRKNGTFPARTFDGLFNASPPNVFLKRKDKAWMDAALFRELVDLLALTIETHRPNSFVIWTFDCDASHLVEEELAYALGRGLHIIVCPAKCTWLLQPLDVGVFGHFKSIFRRRYKTLMIERGLLWLPIPLFLQVFYATLEECLGRVNIPRIFEKVGLRNQQGDVSRLVKRALQSPIPAIPALEPTAEQVGALLPRNRRIPKERFFEVATVPAALSDGVAPLALDEAAADAAALHEFVENGGHPEPGRPPLNRTLTFRFRGARQYVPPVAANPASASSQPPAPRPGLLRICRPATAATPRPPAPPVLTTAATASTPPPTAPPEPPETGALIPE